MAWTTLDPSGGLTFVPGAFYAVVASVKASHTQAEITQLAASKGLTLVDYAEQGQRAGLGPDPRSPDYKYVAAIAQAQKTGTLRTSVPWPVSMVDDSHVVSAWSAPPAAAAPAAPTPPAPVSVTTTPVALWPLLVLPAGVGIGALWNAWRRRRRRR